jgi:hypothetical protein
MRKELKTRVNTFHLFSAIVVGIGGSKQINDRRQREFLALADVRLAKQNKQVADHVWVDRFPFLGIELEAGDLIQFMAKVKPYRKRTNMRNKPYAMDFGLDNCCHVKKISRHK